MVLGTDGNPYKIMKLRRERITAAVAAQENAPIGQGLSVLGCQ